jgi:uncharacterized protein YqeY
MLLNTRIEELIGESMKSGNAKRTGTLRLIKAAFLNYTKQDSKNKLDEVAEIDILKKLAKQREESIAIYKANNREDLVSSEEAELEVIKEFLPPEVSKDEIEKRAIEIVTVKEKSKMGEYIKQLKQEFPGADGKTVANVVMKIING